jgi:transglutaminase-like putative cysteine protease
MEQYLRSTEIIDWKHPVIFSKAEKLAAGKYSAAEIAKTCFEWVRDHIRHIGDFNIQTVSVSASEVLLSGSGICYAKSHLLAALLRANSKSLRGFVIKDSAGIIMGVPFCLHGLNAVYLPETGWYRVDARGNREGVNAQFTPPKEQLAFAVTIDGEIDFPQILSDPLPAIIETLRKYMNKDTLWKNLPDLQSI